MYTQCPECGVAFRVTAEVLKQAAGKVRCGGCGIAFNALEHLSEQRPVAPAQAGPASSAHVPELTPDAPGDLEADTPPKTISAEQSAALLKTLDQLAGSDIRIEDTGVEWRVLDDDEDDLAKPVADEKVDPEAGLPSKSELIADTGSLRFVIEGEQDALPEDQEPEDPPQVIDQMRFDDNTPLPDDFDFASEPAETPAPEVSPPPPASAPETEAESEALQADLALGDPDEWQDLLGDLEEPALEATQEPEADEKELAAEEEPVDLDDDIAMLADPSTDDRTDKPLDMDTQFAIQAEAMGIDLSGVHDTGDDDPVEAEEELAAGDESETSIEEDLIAAAFEAEAAVQAMEDSGAGALADEDEDEEVEEEEIEIDAEIEPEDEDETEDNVEDIAMVFDDKVEEIIETIAMSLDDEPEETPTDGTSASVEHVIPEMTEEEKTINMMIDQELFNIAVEDEDGFASTIVQIQPDKKVDKELDDDKKEVKGDPPQAVETIIMEGDFVHTALDKDRLAPDKDIESRRFEDPGVSIPLKKTMRGVLRGDRRQSDPPGIGVYTGIVVLLLVLIAQVLHQSREALATIPAFNSAVGPVYRMLGKPVTPTWDVSGWRFEATKGSTDEADQLLTIYSRVGNDSDSALPYPLVHLSLTDRFEEIIGSRVLDPGEYLAEDADPRRPVPPGNTFNAVISIESPSEEATGFKLNVCYRLASGQLRCAIEDFK